MDLRRAPARLLVGLAVVAVGLLLVERNWLWRVDNVLYDAALRVWSQPPPADVVIVAVDEASLAKLGRWPWPRRRHADLVRALGEAGARAVALDIIFAEPDRAAPADDAALAAAIAANGRVVLPVLMEQPYAGGPVLEQLPVPPLAGAAAALGHVHVELDADGIARSVYLREGLGDPRWPALAVALLRVAEPGRPAVLPGARAPAGGPDGPRGWRRDHHVRVPFAGPPGTFPALSYAQVLEGRFPAGALRGRLVLVGVTATGLGDALPTPVSGLGAPMPGVEFHANVLAALLEGRAVTPAGTAARLAWTALLAWLPVLVYPRLSPRGALLAAGGLLAGVLGLAAAQLVWLRVWLGPAPALVAVALSYPLWSWLRLEVAMRYLGRELERLRAEHARIGGPAREPGDGDLGLLGEAAGVAGVTVLDAAGRVLARYGEAPPDAGSRPGVAADGGWLERDDEAWRPCAPGADAGWIGVRWRAGAKPPEPGRRRLLDDLAAWVPPPRAPEPRGTLEVVQARIAELQRAADRLREVRALADQGLDQMAAGVVLADPRGRVRSANRTAARDLGGDEAAALAGRDLVGLLGALTPEPGPGWSDTLARVVVGRERAVSAARGPGGRDLLVHAAPFVDEAGRLRGVLLSLADVSALRESERRRAEVLGFLSHDLRSPLVSMLAALELAAEDAAGPERDVLGRLEAHARRTLDLAEQFLELTRAESQEELRLEPLDLDTLAREALDRIAPQAERKGVRVEERLGDAPVEVLGDERLLARAVQNLLDNAVKYTPAGGRVEVSVSVAGAEARCAVADDGPGIAPEDRARIFERFGRAGDAATRRERGAGLGLAFVRAVAGSHGGRVELASEPGRGSRFTLVLPVAPPP